MRQKKLVFALLGLLALGLVGCNKLKARDNLNKGVRAFREARYEAAINYFQEAIELDPELTNAELYLATAYSQQFIPGGTSEENQKNADMAVKTFENVLKRESDNVSAIAGLASIYQNTNRFDKAKEYYLKHATLEPDNAEAHYSVGSVDWIIVFDKSNPRSPEEKAQLIEEGLQQLDKAITINPDYEDAMTYKNLLYREKANLTDNDEEKKQLVVLADEWFNKALETRKRNAEKKKQGGIVIDK